MDEAIIRERVLKEMGHAPADRREAAQLQRMTETLLMGNEKALALLEFIRSRTVLPSLNRHLYRHGNDLVELGIQDVAAYMALVATHFKRRDVKVFTYITTKPTAHCMWIFVGIDNGVVAMYNESKQSVWSVYRQIDLPRYLEVGRHWWVEVKERDGEVVFSLVR